MKFAASTGNPAWGKIALSRSTLKAAIEIAITHIPVANFM
jgi:hypothetical protein